MHLSPLLAVLFISSLVPAHAKTHCAPAPKSTPKLQYDFSVAINFAPTIDLGTGIYSADQSYLASIGGSVCAKWNGGTTGTILVSRSLLTFSMNRLSTLAVLHPRSTHCSLRVS